ncbi:ribose 5-phosphate isomerase B [Candidatus Margulisiibacteriota bacterium]
MKIALGNDHGGLSIKQAVIDTLKKHNSDVIDIGVNEETSVDYTDYTTPVIEKIKSNEVERGIVICGTGIGMSIAANRYKGIRAALCHNEETAEMSRSHNNANVLVLGGRILSPEQAAKITEIWLTTDFEGGRHQRRLDKIDNPQ